MSCRKQIQRERVQGKSNMGKEQMEKECFNCFGVNLTLD